MWPPQYPRQAKFPSRPSPQVDRLVHLPRFVGPVDALARACRLVGCAHDLQHLAAVFARLDWFLLALHTASEVSDFLGEAVVPDLLEHREGVTLRRGRLLDGVAIATLA